MPDKLPSHMSSLLSGTRILICRPEESAQELAQTLSAVGAECRCLPTLIIVEVPVEEMAKQRILNLDQYQHIIVTSQHAAKLGSQLIDSYWPQLPLDQYWYPIGQKTASLLCQEGINVVQPNADLTSEALLKLASLNKVKGQKILLLKGEEGRDALAQILIKRGAQVDSLTLYRRECPEYSLEQLEQALGNFNADYVVTLSGETLLNLILLCEQSHIDLSSKTFIVPSHRVANIAYKHGFKSVLIPVNLRPIDLLKSIAGHKNNRG